MPWESNPLSILEDLIAILPKRMDLISFSMGKFGKQATFLPSINRVEKMIQNGYIEH